MANQPLFDPEVFMNQSTEAEMDTHVIPVAENEYPAVIDSVTPRSGISEKGPWATLDISWLVTDAEESERTGREKLIIRQSLFLDVDEQGLLAVGQGKNLQLGRLREAVGQNRPGNWSPTMLVGQAATVLVSHRIYEGETYDEIKKVRELG